MSATRRYAALWLLVAAVGCGSSEPAVGHRSTGMKHAVNADTAYQLGRFGTSAQRYRRSLVHLRAADDQPAVARTLHNLGMSLKAQGVYREAIARLRESAELHRRLAKPEERALNLLAIAECHHELGEEAPAREALSQAAALAQKGGFSGLAARAEAGLGAARVAAGDIESGKKHYAKAEKLAKGADDPGALALVHHNLGRLSARSGDHKRATTLFLQAAEGFRKARDGDGLSSSMAAAAASMTAQGGDANEAATLYQRAAYAATSVKRYRRAASYFADAARLFRAAGKPELAGQCQQGGRRVLDAWEKDRAM